MAKLTEGDLFGLRWDTHRLLSKLWDRGDVTWLICTPRLEDVADVDLPNYAEEIRNRYATLTADYKSAIL